MNNSEQDHNKTFEMDRVLSNGENQKVLIHRFPERIMEFRKFAEGGAVAAWIAKDLFAFWTQAFRIEKTAYQN